MTKPRGEARILIGLLLLAAAAFLLVDTLNGGNGFGGLIFCGVIGGGLLGSGASAYRTTYIKRREERAARGA